VFQFAAGSQIEAHGFVPTLHHPLVFKIKNQPFPGTGFALYNPAVAPAKGDGQWMKWYPTSKGKGVLKVRELDIK